MSWHRCNLPKQMIIPMGLRRLYPFFVSAPPRGSRTISTPSGQILKWWINSFVWVLSSAKDSFRFGSTFEIPKCFSFNPISLMLANQETYRQQNYFSLETFPSSSPRWNISNSKGNNVEGGNKFVSWRRILSDVTMVFSWEKHNRIWWPCFCAKNASSISSIGFHN